MDPSYRGFIWCTVLLDLERRVTYELVLCLDPLENLDTQTAPELNLDTLGGINIRLHADGCEGT